MSNPRQQSPPYPSKAAGIGGLPSVLPDVVVCAILIVCFLGFAAMNMIRFQKNRRRQYKFLPTVLLFGFCMARFATLVLRIAWATHQHNVRLAIAANVFVNAGVLILYVINLVFAQRILKAEHPKVGWHPVLKYIVTAFYAGIGIALACVIAAAVLSAYTLNPLTLQKCRDIQLAGITYLFIFVTIPVILLLISQLLPKDSNHEQFGEGSLTSKKLVVLVVGLLLILIAGFKMGTAWMPVRPVNNPAWYHSKYCFYFLNFAVELLVLFIFTIVTRPDRMFFVPNGSKAAGDYTRLLLSRDGSEIPVEQKV